MCVRVCKELQKNMNILYGVISAIFMKTGYFVLGYYLGINTYCFGLILLSKINHL